MKIKTKTKNRITLATLLLITAVGVTAHTITYLLTDMAYASAKHTLSPRAEYTEPVSMKQWVWERLEANLGVDEAINGMMIIQCESGWNPMALHTNTNGTVDIGLWQWNMPLHANRLSPEQAFNYQIATDFAINKYWEDGNSWRAWVCASRLGIR